MAEQIASTQKFSYPANFGSYLDGRYIGAFGVDDLTLALAEAAPAYPLEEAVINLPKAAKIMDGELEMLTYIEHKENGVRFFDFDGEKKKGKEATAIKAAVEKERDALQLQIAQTDMQLLAKALHSGDKAAITHSLLAYRAMHQTIKELDEAVNGVYETLRPLLQGEQMDINQAQMLADSLRTIKSPLLQGAWEKLLAPDMPQLPGQLVERTTTFFSKNYYYFAGDSFFDTEINELIELCKALLQQGAELVFEKHKALWVAVDNLLTSSAHTEESLQVP